MKTALKLAALIILLVVVGIVIPAQQTPPDRAVVSFSNPAKPGQVVVDINGGSILVKGYEGKDVIVEARWREKPLTGAPVELREPREPREPREGVVPVPRPPAPPAPAAAEEEEEEEKDPEQMAREKARAQKAKGMKAINVESTGLTIEEEENVIRVELESLKRGPDLLIQVPFSTSLRIECGFGGPIAVEGVNGEIEVESGDATINLNNVSGPVVADTAAGDINAVFGKVNPSKLMVFSTMDGDIDITLPFDTKTSVRMKSEQGQIFTDFDMKLTPSQQKEEEDERKEGGRYRVSFEKTSLGLINGGGVEIQLNTFMGSIYIRKAK